MEDILKRLGNVESEVSELKSQVNVIQATMPHLVTKADVRDVRTDLAELRAEMAAGQGLLRAEIAAVQGSLRTELAGGLGSLRADMAGGLGSLRADMAGGLGSLRADMAARDITMIKWLIATTFTAVGLAFTIAKLVH